MHKENLNIIISYLRENPEAHDQDIWASSVVNGRVKKEDEVTINCNTTGCLAGHAGFRFSPTGTTFYSDHMSLPEEPEKMIFYSSYAQKVFDLKDWEAGYLFDANRTLEEIDDFVNDSEEYATLERQCGCDS